MTQAANKHLNATGGACELRHRAEHRLRKQPGGGARNEIEADPQRLLHELQIHRIELELQNEELRQSKAEVDASLEKYTDLYDLAPLGYFSLDEQGTILEVNLTGAALLGLDRSSLTNRRFQLFVAPPSRPAFSAFLSRTFAGREKQACEASLLNAGRKSFSADLLAMCAVGYGAEGKWCRVAVTDITARKEAELAQRRIDILAATNRRLEKEIIRRQATETALRNSEQRALQLLDQSHQLQRKLRQMSHRILQVQENQRKEISRELHDEISQLLLSINIHLEILTKKAASNPQGIGRNVAQVRRLVKKSVRIVHDFARELRPAMLDDVGLIPALQSYISDFSKRKGVQIDFTAFAGAEALENDKRAVLYRVTQEALANIAKHARASVVKVVIFKARDGVCLEIADNGKGFDVGRLSSADWDNRLGLTGMRERVEMVAGLFNVASAPGEGTKIRVEVSFKRKRQERGAPTVLGGAARNQKADFSVAPNPAGPRTAEPLPVPVNFARRESRVSAGA